jgi:hypothetical protein
VISDVVSSHGDAFILCGGDHNARVGNRYNYKIDDNNTYLPLADIYECDNSVYLVRQKTVAKTNLVLH